MIASVESESSSESMSVISMSSSSGTVTSVSWEFRLTISANPAPSRYVSGWNFSGLAFSLLGKVVFPSPGAIGTHPVGNG